MTLPFLCSYYSTVKYVHIQDVRLGALRLGLLLAIVAYVVIVELAQLGGYLESNAVVGAVRFSLQQPTLNNCDPSNENCTNAFCPLDELFYCQQSKSTTNSTSTTTTTTSSNDYQYSEYPGTIMPCQIFEAVNAQVLRETSLVVWTRATTYNQSLICGDGSEKNDNRMTCPRTYQNNVDVDEHSTSTTYPTPFYIAQAEAFTILLEHAVTASKICEKQQQNYRNKKELPYACSAQASETTQAGRLYSNSQVLCQEQGLKNFSFDTAYGTHLSSTAPCYIEANRTKSNQQDFFSLDVLLQAAGVSSLDECTEEATKQNNNSSSPCVTYRESGATLLLNVVWNDFRSFQGLVTPFYYYSPRIIGTSYKESIPFYSSYRTDRILLRAHGIKIAVLMAGHFHHFDVLSFLITLTTALGLLAVATTVVDSFMLYVLPEKERYQQVKYETVVTVPSSSTTSTNNNVWRWGNRSSSSPAERNDQAQQQQQQAHTTDDLELLLATRSSPEAEGGGPSDGHVVTDHLELHEPLLLHQEQ